MITNIKLPSKFLYRQILLSTIGLVQGSCAGGAFAFTSIVFAQLKHDHTIELDDDTKSWLASILSMVMIPSCFLSGIVTEKLGRKLTTIIVEVLALLSWLLTYFATDYAMMLAARILMGIYLGTIYPLFITYIGEVAKPQYRTLFLTAIPVGTSFGVFICQFLGEYIHWKTVVLIFLVLHIYDLLIIFYIKESYVTHLDRNKIEQALVSFKWFRGIGNDTKHEFDEIVEEKKKKTKETFLHLLHTCLNKAFLIPLSITTMVFLTNELTGSQAIISYTSQIMEMIRDDKDFVYYATLSLNILRIVAVILSLILVKITSVRFILIVSGYLLAASLLALALSMYLSVTYVDNSVYPITSLIFLVLNTVLFSIGLGPLPSVVCGEMFPPATRGIGGAISAAASFLFLFITVKFMPLLLSTIGPSYTFLIFAIFTLGGIIGTHIFLPHTKNKTLLEINKLYDTDGR